MTSRSRSSTLSRPRTMPWSTGIAPASRRSARRKCVPRPRESCTSSLPEGPERIMFGAVRIHPALDAQTHLLDVSGTDDERRVPADSGKAHVDAVRIRAQALDPRRAVVLVDVGFRKHLAV